MWFFTQLWSLVSAARQVALGTIGELGAELTLPERTGKTLLYDDGDVQALSSTPDFNLLAASIETGGITKPSAFIGILDS
jgi:hypothetical protein